MATASGGHRYIEVYWRYFESAKKNIESANFKALALWTIFKALVYTKKKY
jgi:hypothetical protein